jgi:hypothetical protein
MHETNGIIDACQLDGAGGGTDIGDPRPSTTTTAAAIVESTHWVRAGGGSCRLARRW